MTTATIGLTEEQLAERTTFVGASEVPAVAGLSPWSTALDVWLSKLGLAEPTPPSDAMEAGNRFEAAIAAWYADRTGAEVRRGETVRHAVAPHRGCTPDLIHLRAPKLTQIKLVMGSSDDWGDEENGEAGVPDYVRAQVITEMDVTGLHEADVCAFVAGGRGGARKLRVYPVSWDADLAAQLAALVDDFWGSYVVPRVQPPIEDGSERTREFLRRRFPRANGQMLPATEHALDLGQRLAEASAAARQWQETAEKLQAQLIEAIGDADGIEGVATYRSDKTGRCAWKAVAEALRAPADLIAAHTGEPTRRFLLKMKGQ